MASINNDTQQTDMANNENATNDDVPIVNAFNIPESQPSIRGYVATLQRLQETELALQHQLRHIKELEFTIAIQESHRQSMLNSDKISLLPSAPPGGTETPGPHRLQQKPERPQDLAFRQKIVQHRQAENITDKTMDTTPTPTDSMMSIFKSLTKVLQDNN
jgi:hypothetical protein